jgi:4-hydroxy-tetrahydrodipicolinate reductase
MAYKVIQWATGGVGVQLLRETINNPDLELVGVKVFTHSKHGRDAGEIAGLADTGITATLDLDAILALDADPPGVILRETRSAQCSTFSMAGRSPAVMGCD